MPTPRSSVIESTDNAEESIAQQCLFLTVVIVRGAFVSLSSSIIRCFVTSNDGLEVWRDGVGLGPALERTMECKGALSRSQVQLTN
jgi:hypothetical protein